MDDGVEGEVSNSPEESDDAGTSQTEKAESAKKRWEPPEPASVSDVRYVKPGQLIGLLKRLDADDLAEFRRLFEDEF